MRADTPPPPGLTTAENAEWLDLCQWIRGRADMFADSKAYNAALAKRASKKRKRADWDRRQEEAYVQRYGPRKTTAELEKVGDIVAKEIEDLFDELE